MNHKDYQECFFCGEDVTYYYNVDRVVIEGKMRTVCKLCYWHHHNNNEKSKFH